MIWKDALKHAGVNIHVIATGAGAGLQKLLWDVPGCSAYLSGCSFPYSNDEQEDLLGFMPEHFCSEEAAVDLASAAYMKAYKFDSKRPVGVGVAASVASEKIHRGDHRIHACVITNDFVRSLDITLEKGIGAEKRAQDGQASDDAGFGLMMHTIFDTDDPFIKRTNIHDSTALARERFFLHPFFTANGKRLADLPKGKYSLMSGAFNPPHEGHFGIAQAAQEQYHYTSVFEITAEPPHKDALSVQTLLQRSQLLKGHNRLFTSKLPYYIDKARKYPGRPMILGADAMVRMMDPKWGLNLGEMFEEFYNLNTKLFISAREVDGKLTTCDSILLDIRDTLPFKDWAAAQIIMKPINGEWNISSTEIREKLQRQKESGNE